MTRNQALASLRVAGYHNDTKEFVRLYIENRISYTNAERAFADGKRAKESGVGCNCFECRHTVQAVRP